MKDFRNSKFFQISGFQRFRTVQKVLKLLLALGSLNQLGMNTSNLEAAVLGSSCIKVGTIREGVLIEEGALTEGVRYVSRWTQCWTESVWLNAGALHWLSDVRTNLAAVEVGVKVLPAFLFQNWISFVIYSMQFSWNFFGLPFRFFFTSVKIRLGPLKKY